MKLDLPIVSTQWLADNLDNPALRLFDVSQYLVFDPDGAHYRVESGLNKWAESHIPGANYLDLLKEFSDTSKPIPATMLPYDKLAERCAAHGIGDDSCVVVYSAVMPMWAARMFWMLRSIGFKNVAILDGSVEKWLREGRPMSTEQSAYAPAQLTARPNPAMWADKAEVLRCIHDEKVCTMNALQPDVYDGSMERYGRAGHIPGSLNVFSDDLFDAQTGEMLPLEELRKKFEQAQPFGRRTIVHCGGGVSAALNAIALEMLGHQDVAVYDGSMYEWCADPALPLVLGAEPG